STTPANWEVKLNNIVVSTSPITSPSFNYHFPLGGTYVLTATTPGGCSSDSFVIVVTQRPPNPTGSIIGETYICEGVTYEYSYTNTVPGTTLRWGVDINAGGMILGSNTGETVSIIFNGPGPHGVSVTRLSADGENCSSTALYKTIYVADINPVITNDDNLTKFCPSIITSFSVDLGGMEADLIEWEVISDDTIPNSNFGNIINGVNSQT